MSTYPLPTLAAQITATGITAPDFSDIVASEVATYQGIYGSDAYLENDSQDYQLIAVRSLAIRDCNALAVAVYNSFLPSYAQGSALSALVAIIGLQRIAGSNSTVNLTLTGVAGTTIANGIVQDTSGNLWNLPANVVIPASGQITVTATAQQPGAIAAAANTVTQMYTIVTGWQSVTNPAAAIPGNVVESDAALRRRQIQSTGAAAQTPLGAILAAAAQSGGIGRYTIYENDTRQTDANGVPGNSVAVVVEGGNITAIAAAIESKKAPGTGTYGTTNVQVLDPAGVPTLINFFEMTEVPVYMAVTIQPLNGYVEATGAALVDALASFTSALAIGGTVWFNWLLGVAGLNGTPAALTFAVTSLLIGTAPNNLAAANIPIAFNAGATCSAANITLTVL